MKKPGSMKPGPGTKEKSQGKLAPSGINKKVETRTMPKGKPLPASYAQLNQKQKA